MSWAVTGPLKRGSIVRLDDHFLYKSFQRHDAWGKSLGVPAYIADAIRSGGGAVKVLVLSENSGFHKDGSIYCRGVLVQGQHDDGGSGRYRLYKDIGILSSMGEVSFFFDESDVKILIDEISEAEVCDVLAGNMMGTRGT